MDGKGIISKACCVTLKRFIDTYMEDLRWWGKRYYTKEGIAHRQSADARGIFTVQYPEEKLPVPEEFRFIPFLIYEEGPERREAGPLHLLRHLRQSLPAAVHLDRAHQRPRHRPPGAGAG